MARPTQRIFNNRQIRRLVYRFDASLNRHIGGALVLLLFGLMLVIVAVGSLMSLPTWGPSNSSVTLLEGWWLGLTRSLDPGTFGNDLGSEFRVLGLVVTLFGILALAIVIGLVSNGVDQRISHLRSGRAEVMESGHFLILGWSNKAAAIVSELLHSSSKKPPRIVVMSNCDRDQVEDKIGSLVGHKLSRHVVVRTGDQTNSFEIARTKPLEARSIIVVNEDEPDADADVVRTLMSLLQLDGGLDSTPVIAEIDDENVAATLNALAGPNLYCVNSLSLVARITAQTLRNPGLSIVYENLLDFNGEELYIVPIPSDGSSTFSQLANQVRNGILLGVVNDTGDVSIAPGADRIVTVGELGIVLALDRESIDFHTKEESVSSSVSIEFLDALNEPETFLILGWSAIGPLVLDELDPYAPPGSKVIIAADPRYSIVPKSANYNNFEISSFIETDSTNYLELTSLLEKFPEVSHILIVCYRNEISTKSSDAKTLLTLAQIRHILDNDTKLQKVTLISELLEIADVSIAASASPDDYVISERLTSLYMAQIAAQPNLAPVLDEFFAAGGHDISFRGLAVAQEFSLSALAATEALRDDVLLGWRRKQSKKALMESGISLNPGKEVSNLFEENDAIITVRKLQI